MIINIAMNRRASSTTINPSVRNDYSFIETTTHHQLNCVTMALNCYKAQIHNSYILVEILYKSKFGKYELDQWQ